MFGEHHGTFFLRWKRVYVWKHQTEFSKEGGHVGNDLQGSPTEGTVAHRTVRGSELVQFRERGQRRGLYEAGSEAMGCPMRVVAVGTESEAWHGSRLCDRP